MSTHAVTARTRNRIRLHWSLFAFTWALACLADRLKRGVYDDPLSLLFVGACAVLLLKPGCLRRFQLLAVVHLAWFASILSGEVLVHWYITATLHAAVLVISLDYTLRNRALADCPSLVWPSLVRTGQVIAASGLFFAGFAKWNLDFLDPRTSCGGIYYLWFREIPGLGILPNTMNARQTAAVLAALAETLGPLAMVWPRTRRLGLLVSWSLLLALAANPRSHYFEFSGLFFAGSLLFLPLDSVHRARLRFWWRLRKLPVGSLTRLRGGRIGLFVATVAILLALSRGHVSTTATLLEGYRVLWLLLAGLILVHLDWRRWLPLGLPRTSIPWSTWVVPVLFTLNEVSPYLGMVHRPVLTMAANSVFYPQYSNHYLVNPIPTFGWTRDVFILDSTNTAIPRGMHMPWILFQDLMHKYPDAEVQFTVDGSEPSTAIAGEDSRFHSGSPIPELLRLQPYFLPVGPNVCAKPPPGLSRKKWSGRKTKIKARVAADREPTGR